MDNQEQALLGALLVYPDQILELEIRPHDFSTDAGAKVYIAVTEMAQKGMTADPMAIGNKIGDTKLIADLAMAGCAKSNIRHYADEVTKGAKMRRLVSAATDVLNGAKNADADPDVLADSMLTQMSHTATSKNVWGMQELMSEVLREVLEARKEHDAGGAVGLSTGFRGLDRMMGGLRGGRLYVIGGRPKMGKTAFALSLQHNAARSGAAVGFASAEMSALECGKRWISCVSGVEASKVQTGALTDAEEERLANASNNLAALPIYILDKAAVSPGRIRRQALAWQQRYGLDMLVVDYLQRLTPDESGERRDLVVGQMCRAFKTLARDLDIPVVLLAQLSRDLERRDDKRPLPSDLRDSGEIEQEADVIGFIYRDWVYNPAASQDLAEVIVRANRHGPSGKATLRFETKFQRWLDMDIATYEAVA